MRCLLSRLLAGLAFPCLVFAQTDYTVDSLTTAGVQDSLPQINDSGQMAWVGTDGAEADIFFYDGSQTIRLPNPGVTDRNPRINNAGQVAWEGNDGTDNDIFFYDGSAVRRLSNAGWDRFPSLNNLGHIVWENFANGTWSVCFFDGSSIRNLSLPGFTDFGPEINDVDGVVWAGSTRNSSDLFLYNGTDVGIVDSLGVHTEPQINDAGDIVWVSCDSTGWAVCLYQDGQVQKFTNTGVRVAAPQLNNKGQVTWACDDGAGWNIAWFDGTAVSVIPNPGYDWAPRISDSGAIVWQAYDGTDWEIFAYDGSQVRQLTANATDDVGPQVNQDGTIVWAGQSGGAGGIFIARPPRDTTPPLLADVSASPGILWPPNHQFVPVLVTATVTDDRDPAPTWRVVSVTSTEPESGLGDGDVGPDWRITGSSTASLRAERFTGARVYTITMQASDAAGNTSTATAVVTVPRSHSKK